MGGRTDGGRPRREAGQCAWRLELMNLGPTPASLGAAELRGLSVDDRKLRPK